jgi:hypothetical protein
MRLNMLTKHNIVLLVFGGRDYTNQQRVFAVLDNVHQLYGIEKIVEGDARGADRLAGEWADARGVQKEVHPADWKKHGRAAGPIRNRSMLKQSNPDAGLGFPGGRGTADMLQMLRTAGVPTAMMKE